MKHLIRLSDLSINDAHAIFRLADEFRAGKHRNCLKDHTVALFFPESSIRTRVTYERGIYLMGGQNVLFPPSALDKKEEVGDVVAYLSNWVSGIVVRHKNIALLDKMANNKMIPIINAMTDVNHPCEMLSDVYALSKIFPDVSRLKILFVGACGNIALAWKEAAALFGFELTQSCPPKYAMDGVENIPDLMRAAIGKDVICTDSLSADKLPDFSGYQITPEIMQSSGCKLLNPCPPFYRGEEVSAEVVKDDRYGFVGYEFKSCLLEVQQAVLYYLLFDS
jgi:Ornithine carbamoyltransferase